MEKLIYVVQYEQSGIPNEPELFSSQEKQEKRAEEMMVSDGMRPRGEDESFDEYYDVYYCIITNDTKGLDSEFENATLPDNDNTIRGWTCKIK
jgi:hypothetical protein